MLPVLWLRPSPGEVRVMNADVLLELLERVVGTGSERVEPGRVKVASRNMPVGHQRVRRNVVG